MKRLPFLFRDVWRGLKANPASAALAVLSLVIGIGTAASVMSIVDTTLLHPLPYAKPGQIFELVQPQADTGQNWPFSYRFFYDAQGQLPVVQSLAALSFPDMILQSDGEPTVLSAVACSGSLFDLLEVSPLLGRPFDRSEEERTQGPSVVLISAELWHGRFGSDPGIVGRTLKLNERLFVIIGVLPPRMRMPPLAAPPALWIPLGADPTLEQIQKMFPDSWDQSAYLDLWARIPGIEGNVSAAEQPIRAAALPLLSQSDPMRSADLNLNVISIEEKLTRRYRPEMYVLLLATLLTLIVACANVFSIMLARGLARRKDASIRVALGATGGGIAASMLLEGLVIALSGATAGLLASRWLLRSLEIRLPEGLLPFSELALNPSIAAWVLIGSALCGIGIALVPAMRLARLEANVSELWTRGSTDSRSTTGFREGIVVVQIACTTLAVLSFLLLYGAYRAITAAPLGFNDRNVLVADLTLPQTTGISGEQMKELGLTLEQRLREQPGVESASIAISAPATRTLRTSYSVGGAAGEQAAIAEYRPVGQSYFSVLGVPLQKGRFFSDADTGSAPAVCLINETLARSCFQNGDELGAQIKANLLPPCKVVGVVGDTAPRNVNDTPPPVIYVPFAQMPGEAIQAFMSVLIQVRGAGTPSQSAYVGQRVIEAARQVAPSFPIEMHSLTAIIAQRSSVERFRAFLMGVVSLIAAMLAALGAYAITTHYVFHKRREMAIRMALGATAGRLIGDVIYRALRLAALGLAIGFAAAFPVFKLIEGFLVGVHALPLSVMAVAAVSVVLLALLSAYLPARRIVGIVPAELLDNG